MSAKILFASSDDADDRHQSLICRLMHMRHIDSEPMYPYIGLTRYIRIELN
jgi:hypothetical protein